MCSIIVVDEQADGKYVVKKYTQHQRKEHAIKLGEGYLAESAVHALSIAKSKYPHIYATGDPVLLGESGQELNVPYSVKSLGRFGLFVTILHSKTNERMTMTVERYNEFYKEEQLIMLDSVKGSMWSIPTGSMVLIHYNSGYTIAGRYGGVGQLFERGYVRVDLPDRKAVESTYIKLSDIDEMSVLKEE
jgi:hypothetical protein